MQSNRPSRHVRRALGACFGTTLALAAALSPPSVARAEKVRDLVEVAGARDNQLIGFGVVTGLGGTGDDQMAPIAARATLEMLRRLGVAIDPKQVLLRNVAAVIVTATLPPFAKPGTKLDVSVSSIGNARSLAGGTLVQALLKGADQKTYAVGQGSVIVGGFSGKGASGSSLKQGSLTAGRIPMGALVEREVVTDIVDDDGKISLSLRSPSFTTASRLSDAIGKSLGEGVAEAVDGGSVKVKVPEEFKENPVALLAKIEDLEVTPVRKSRIVISERNGTIIAGGDVRLAPVAIVHGSLTIVVRENPTVAQPILGQGTKVEASEVTAKEKVSQVQFVEGAASLADVADALGALGLSARELASVLSAMKTAGALEAEVVIE